MSRPSLVLVDDHQIVRAGASALLRDRFEIVGEAADVDEAVAVITATEPAVALIDVNLPSGSGADVVKRLREAGVATRFLALSVSAARGDVAMMLNAGVDGYLLKSTLGADLAGHIDDVLDGGRPVSPEIAGYMLDIDDDAATNGDVERLTPREREVVQFIARGYSYKQVAAEMYVSPKTIEAHMAHIFKKLGVASRHQLSIEAQRRGLIDPRRPGAK